MSSWYSIDKKDFEKEVGEKLLNIFKEDLDLVLVISNLADFKIEYNVLSSLIENEYSIEISEYTKSIRFEFMIITNLTNEFLEVSLYKYTTTETTNQMKYSSLKKNLIMNSKSINKINEVLSLLVEAIRLS